MSHKSAAQEVLRGAFRYSVNDRETIFSDVLYQPRAEVRGPSCPARFEPARFRLRLVLSPATR